MRSGKGVGRVASDVTGLECELRSHRTAARSYWSESPSPRTTHIQTVIESDVPEFAAADDEERSISAGPKSYGRHAGCLPPDAAPGSKATASTSAA